MNNSLLLFMLLVLNVSCHKNDIDCIKHYQSDEYKISYTKHKGKNALEIKRFVFSPNGGLGDQAMAYVDGLDFKDGIIELDIASGDSTSAYLGFFFRMQNQYSYETVYFRPACCSGTPDAVQYMPSLDKVFNWWDFTDTVYKAKAELPRTDWFHVKAVVNGAELKLYLDNYPVPIMHYTHLDTARIKHGSVGYWLGNSPKGYFANLKVTDLTGSILYVNKSQIGPDNPDQNSSLNFKTISFY